MGDEAIGTAATLQTSGRVTAALGDGALVTGTRAGYTLEVDPSAVDALEVLHLAEQASAFRSAGDASAALETCTTALAMFTGEILSGAGEGDWLIPHRARLEEVRLGLIECQLAVRLDLGAASDVIGELEALVRLHPLREGLWALLLVALYRDGRQADALRRTNDRPLPTSSPRPWLQLQHSSNNPVPRPSLGVPSSHVRGLGSDMPRGTCRRSLSSLSSRGRRRCCVRLLAAETLVESSGQAVSARRPSRSRPAAAELVSPCRPGRLVGQLETAATPACDRRVGWRPERQRESALLSVS